MSSPAQNAQSSNRQKASLTRTASSDSHSSEAPAHPPGLNPDQTERLWRPHEDKYWNNLRDMWGSNSDLNDHEHGDDHEFDADTDEASSSQAGSSTNSRRHSREVNSNQSQNQNGPTRLVDTSGNVFDTFKIDLPGRHPKRTVAVGGLPEQVATRTSQERQGTNALSNSAPLPKALSIHLPPPAHTKSKSNNKKLLGNAINVTVTTTTRTYGDFSKANPPPYTPRPTATERSFGSNGKATTVDKKGKKWPVAKWLFIFGFLFPLCWLFGSFLLFSGLRALHAQAQLEENESRNAKFEYDTPMSSTIYSNPQIQSQSQPQSYEETIAHRIAQEIVWSKRCAWAFAAFAAICIGTFVALKAIGV